MLGDIREPINSVECDDDGDKVDEKGWSETCDN